MSDRIAHTRWHQNGRTAYCGEPDNNCRLVAYWRETTCQACLARGVKEFGAGSDELMKHAAKLEREWRGQQPATPVPVEPNQYITIKYVQ